MKPFESTENYLECILMLGEKKPCVHSVDVAHQLGVSKPTVSVTMKRLREQGYLTVSADGVPGTDRGRAGDRRAHLRAAQGAGADVYVAGGERRDGLSGRPAWWSTT